MKTLIEVCEHVAQLNNKSWDDILKELANSNDPETLQFYIIGISTLYAKEAIDECAYQAKASINSLPGFGQRVNKGSILNVKNQLYVR